ncbi:MAG: ATP-binding cassette domain-containing protein, partial [Spirochaetes bacterium]|nr:ATP-binding cassette domain-containing protein [Spirochaetota bacterium]
MPDKGARGGRMDGSSILIDDCQIGDAMRPALRSASLRLSRGEAWAVVGPSGGGKEALALALSGGLPVVPNEGGAYRNDLAGAAAVVSFGAAAALLAEERRDDDSDFVEGGLSEGRTVRDYLAARLPVREAGLFPGGVGLEAHPAVVACGVAGGSSGSFLDRGLKRLSTGECRRVLLCRALSSGPALIVVSEPYEGLDAPSRERLRGTLESLAEASARGDPGTPALVVVDALERVPSAVGLVVEVSGGAVTYAGSRAAYES